MLFNEIIIDEIRSTIRFDLFYSQCYPTYCAYSYLHRFHIIFIITTLFGILGDLSFILKFLVRFIVAMILRWKHKNTSNNTTSTNIRQNRWIILLHQLQLLPYQIKQKIVRLNIFEDQTPCTPITIFREQFLTRIFIVLISICSIISSYDIYQELYEKYPNTLKCSCQQVSILYKMLINVTFVLHQVYSNDLVSSTWLYCVSSLNPIELSYTEFFLNFRAKAESHINDATDIFSNTRFINYHSLPPPLFVQQTVAIIESYIDHMRDDFQRSVNWNQIGLDINQVLTGTNTNVYIYINKNGSFIFKKGYFVRRFYLGNDGNYAVTGTCECEFEYKDIPCLRKNFLFPNRTNELRYGYIFLDLPVGCVPLNGFLISTFS
ncbi:unnamed protein product [Adineta ricciae]|uniref:Uncharacterized protein n=1 Tax=Adineta ricciae TaxID=249248 RepID=A0A813ZKV3_ADIRI|nr:unnamed protein product [Adineta ricciae]